MNHNIVIWAGVMLLCLGSSDARSSGADPAACSGMVPSHGTNTPQTGAAPYTITFQPANYTFSGAMTVTVTITATGNSPILGYLIQARNADPSLSQMDVLGTWNVVAGQQLLCSGSPGPGDALTHNPKATTTSLSAVWNPVSGANPNPGHVKFLATIVSTFSTFWVKEESLIAFETSTNPLTTTGAPTTPLTTPVAPATPSTTLLTTTGAPTTPGTTTTVAATTGASNTKMQENLIMLLAFNCVIVFLM